MSEPERLDRTLLRRFPLPHHPDDGDKEQRGRLLLIAGSRELPGAAELAGMAALRAGCGKLQIATAQGIAVPLGIAVPEARVIGCEETEDGCLAAASIEPLLGWARGAQAIMIGSGMQVGPPLEALLDALLGSGLDKPLVLDAAVLGCLAPRAETLRAWQGGAVLLPHAREMARLLDCETAEVEADPLAATRRAAGHYGAVAMVKGQYSYIVAPDGRSFRFEGGGVGLATSGSGDCLAGIVGGLCARGADPLAAALWGVHLHGEAGRRLAREVGRIGFLARELLDQVPALLDQTLASEAR
jgi:ADP-dependent NAD(P)H-hydrate dehydratase